MQRELIHTEEKDGFTINFYVSPEYDDPKGHFASGDDEADAELCQKIYDGDLAWFIAEVTASKEGVKLGSDYLGGCCYDSPQDFVKAGDYYADMVSNAIEEARKTLKKLCELIQLNQQIGKGV